MIQLALRSSIQADVPFAATRSARIDGRATAVIMSSSPARNTPVPNTTSSTNPRTGTHRRECSRGRAIDRRDAASRIARATPTVDRLLAARNDRGAGPGAVILGRQAGRGSSPAEVPLVTDGQQYWSTCAGFAVTSRRHHRTERQGLDLADRTSWRERSLTDGQQRASAWSTRPLPARARLTLIRPPQ